MRYPMTIDTFAIVPVTHGPAPDDAIVVGDLCEVMAYIPQSIARNGALEELEKARFTADQIASMQQKTRAVQVSMLTDSVNHLSSRFDSLLEQRSEAARARAKAEEEAEQQRIADELASLPDPDNPGVHENTGDLHDLPAKSSEDQTEFELPEDPSGTVTPQPTAIEFDEV
jgi:hypothetical protein